MSAPQLRRSQNSETCVGGTPKVAVETWMDGVGGKSRCSKRFSSVGWQAGLRASLLRRQVHFFGGGLVQKRCVKTQRRTDEMRMIRSCAAETSSSCERKCSSPEEHPRQKGRSCQVPHWGSSIEEELPTLRCPADTYTVLFEAVQSVSGRHNHRQWW